MENAENIILIKLGMRLKRPAIILIIITKKKKKKSQDQDPSSQNID
jgi:hypothetical protein